MSLLERIKADQLRARKEQNQQALSTLQVLLSSIQNEQIDADKELTDEDISRIVSRNIKQLKDALKDFESGGRRDLVDKTNQEIKLKASYLPEQMSDEELERVARKYIEPLDQKDASKIGPLTGQIMSEVKGRADGGRVRAIVERLLIA